MPRTCGYKSRYYQQSAQPGIFRKENSAEPPFFGTAAAQPPFFKPLVQRQCNACDEDGIINTSSVDPLVNQQGAKLPAELRRYFSQRIGGHFDDVQIHTDAAAAMSANDLQARAYTTGNHIVFGEGQYQPDTLEGKRLIAHELTHVVQQQHGAVNCGVQRDTKDDLQKTFKITIKKGDKDWAESEITLLKAALGRLAGDEIAVVRDYQFIRWSSKEARAKNDTSYKDPGTSECALHEMDLANASYKISVYDACFADPEARAGTDTKFGIDTGEFHILHEIGHAMESAELRKTYEAYMAANKAYNDYIEKNKDKDVTKAMQAEADRLTKAEDAAKKAMDDATGRALAEFTELMKGLDAITPYGKTDSQESFAEMFAAFKANPEVVKKDYKQVYEWLVGKGFLKHIEKKKK